MDTKSRNSGKGWREERPPSSGSTSSITSYFSARTTITCDERTQEADRPESVDLGNSSIYSPPSAVSTDYGLYYTRMALSEEGSSKWSNYERSLDRLPDDTVTVSEGMSPSIIFGTDESTGKYHLLQGATADTEHHIDRGFLDETVRTLFKSVENRPAHRFICDSSCQTDKQRVHWVTTLSIANGLSWKGKGDTEAKARQNAIRKALNKLAKEPGNIYRFYVAPETQTCRFRLISICRLLGHEDPQYEYILRGSGGENYRTPNCTCTCIVTIDGMPYAWASGYRHDWAREKAAAYALADLNDKHPGHLP